MQTSQASTMEVPRRSLRRGLESRVYMLLRPYRPAIWIGLAFIILSIVFCLFLFFFVELPFEQDLAQIRIAADTGTYFKIADEYRRNSGAGMVLLSFGGNVIGPLATALIFNTPFNIMLFNIALFLGSIVACGAVKEVNRPLLAVLLLLNGSTLVSLVTLNKEIFALSASLLLCRYIYTGRRSKILLLVSLGIGMMARWQQSFISILFLFLTREGSYFDRHRRRTLVILILLITVSYPIVLKTSVVDIGFATNLGGDEGTIAVLNKLQANFLFPLVLIPKAVMSLTNRTFTITYWFSKYWEQDFTDLANQLIVHWQGLAMTVALVAAYFTDRLSLRRPIPFFISLYLVITCANAFIQPRYQYPVYVFLCFDLAMNSDIVRQPILKKLSFSVRPPIFRALSIRHEILPQANIGTETDV